MFKFIDNENQNENENVTNEYIESLEKKFNIKFPKILREYYLKHNTAVIKECHFNKNGINFDVDEIISINYGTYPFEKEYNYVLNNKNISNDLIPFASCSGVETYSWNSKDGKVYYTSEDTENPTYVCDSVVEFFDLLNKSVLGNTVDNKNNFASEEETLISKQQKLNNIYGNVCLALVITLILLAIIYNIFYI